MLRFLALPTTFIAPQRDIFELISKRPGINQKQLVEATGQTQPMVSMHLKTLAEREYILAERLGRTMIYYINEEGEGTGETLVATAVGKDLGSLVGAEAGVNVAGSLVPENRGVTSPKAGEGMADRKGVEVRPVVRGVPVAGKKE